jgi:hypothetical protein
MTTGGDWYTPPDDVSGMPPLAAPLAARRPVAPVVVAGVVGLVAGLVLGLNLRTTTRQVTADGPRVARGPGVVTAAPLRSLSPSPSRSPTRGPVTVRPAPGTGPVREWTTTSLRASCVSPGVWTATARVRNAASETRFGGVRYTIYLDNRALLRLTGVLPEVAAGATGTEELHGFGPCVDAGPLRYTFEVLTTS